MTRQTLIPALFAGLAPLLAVLGGCAAFIQGPQTEAATAANRATPGYPRLADVPPPPPDLLCETQPRPVGPPNPNNLLDAMRDLGNRASDVVPPPRAVARPAAPVICPPDLVDDAATLAAERERLERVAADMRANAPVAPPQRVALPEDFPARPGTGGTAP